MRAIAAISTPVGAGGIGILRVSGEDALAVASAVFICGSKGSRPISDTPLMMRFGTFDAGDFRDRGYAVFFPAARWPRLPLPPCSLNRLPPTPISIPARAACCCRCLSGSSQEPTF